MGKEVKFGPEARKAMRNGIDILADAVGSTLGPKGNLVVIGKFSVGKPYVTKDGVTVAKNISFTDEYQDAGAQLIKEAALKQLVVGDGTTTTTILAQALIHQIDELLTKGESAVKIKEGLEKDLKKVISSLKEYSSPVKDIEDLKKIATISANNDSEIGELLAKAFSIVSKEGVITVDESSNIDTTIEAIQGMQFEQGFVSRYFCTDEVKNIAVLDHPYIMITNQKIHLTKEIIPIIENVYKEGKSLLIIAEDFDGEVINNLAMNLQNGLRVCCVKCPSFGDYRTPILEDIAILTDGKVATYENTIEPKDVTMEMLGRAEKIVITSSTTTILNGEGDKATVNNRVQTIKTQLKESLEDPQHSEFIINMFNNRIAKLAGGVAVVHVGGTTELERNERKDRIEDAIAATKSALEEGIVPGGGTAYFNAAADNNLLGTAFGNVLTTPLELLVKSCDKTFDFVSERLLMSSNKVTGFNAKTGEVVSNMLEEGIIDPLKTVRMALLNAVSVAELYLMTNCIIVPEKID